MVSQVVCLARRRLTSCFSILSPLASLTNSQEKLFHMTSSFNIKGFASDALAPREKPAIPATVVVLKNPTPRIEYDESVHRRLPPGDPSKRAFIYFVLTGGRFIYASAIRLAIVKSIVSMSAFRLLY
ncbi:hypothetical protein O6H91_08G016100 [Diphasiastrum complanatum]|uniref:Uncharacterized protein n=1 Tax=Diphasiastrum complanatum TaxID=34168 RepID=A0ACC2CVI1_DIPCM|nr:hypothetical protein O6H91_08G016100 [Diphasiastrum complanatum]